jgi:hypothetical protein
MAVGLQQVPLARARRVHQNAVEHLGTQRNEKGHRHKKGRKKDKSEVGAGTHTHVHMYIYTHIHTHIYIEIAHLVALSKLRRVAAQHVHPPPDKGRQIVLQHPDKPREKESDAQKAGDVARYGCIARPCFQSRDLLMFLSDHICPAWVDVRDWGLP